jgi:hypothetical protein
MKERRDIFQRKVAATRRMDMAMARLTKAISIAEKEQANRWVAAWGSIASIRQFKLERPGKKRVPRLGQLGQPGRFDSGALPAAIWTMEGAGA